jgi:hypothetical protein
MLVSFMPHYAFWSLASSSATRDIFVCPFLHIADDKKLEIPPHVVREMLQ